ncbi:hypothetical protein NDU88_005230, partial [Pleurodeles waltl]
QPKLCVGQCIKIYEQTTIDLRTSSDTGLLISFRNMSLWLQYLCLLLLLKALPSQPGSSLQSSSTVDIPGDSATPTTPSVYLGPGFMNFGNNFFPDYGTCYCVFSSIFQYILTSCKRKEGCS